MPNTNTFPQLWIFNIFSGQTCTRFEMCNAGSCYAGVECRQTSRGIECGPCPRGYEGDGRDCRRIDYCKYNPCAPGTSAPYGV